MTALFVLLSVGIGVMIWLVNRRLKQVKQARKSLFSDVEKLMTDEQSMIDRAGFPQLVGQYCNHAVSLRLEVDDLSSAKLMNMWIHITLPRPFAAQGSLDILVRPQPSDVFSPGWNWPKTLTPPKNWPQHARYSSQGRVPMLQLIDSDIRTIFADQQAKEILITPESIRFTYLIRQANRIQYRLLRSAEFDKQAIDSAVTAACIRQLQKLLVNLDGAQCDEAA